MKKALPLSLSANRKRYLPIGFIVLFALVGVTLLLLSHAASPYVAIEAETGATGGATSATDSNASGGSYLQFGTKSTTTPPPTTGSTSGGCTSGGVVAPCVGSATTGASGWGTPVFDDEFANDGNKLNSSDWTTGWFNSTATITNTVSSSEADCYDANDVTVANGYLDLAINSDSGVKCDNTTRYYDDGFITTMNASSNGDLFNYTYGFAEARMFLQNSSNSCSITATSCSGQVANYPSWWLGDQNDGQSGNSSTEIDIVEGLDGPVWHIHGPNGVTDCYGQPTNQESNAGVGWAGWHTFGVAWSPGTATVYYDGKVVGSTCNTKDLSSPTAGPMYLILSETPGGGYSSDPTVTPSNLYVSYVRVWPNQYTTYSK